jgi:phosphoglucosamine mutase
MGKELFGTDGIRGTPGTYPLDDRTIYWVGRALGEYVRTLVSPVTVEARGPRVLIGMDTRESCTHIARRLLMGLTGAGLQGHFAGVITTPGVAHLVHTEGFAAGVVISASHNPYTDNGIKLFAGTGMKFPDEIEAQIEAEILKHQDGEPKVAEVKLEADLTLDRRYCNFVAGRAIPGAKLEKMKIVLDCANGAATNLGPTVFRALGADVAAIHDHPDGRNINAACGALHPENLQKKVVETQAALGVAFDGDGDRAIFVSASGKVVNGDGVLLAAARHLKSAGQLKGSTIVGTTMANLGLEHALAKDGLKLARVPVGDRYVLEEMLRGGANLGGEQSGHVIFLDDATTGDGLLTAVKVASLVALRGPLDALVADLKVFPQTIVNVRVKSKPPLESLPPVQKALDDANRALGDRGRIVLRYSGTESLARVMVEAERQEDVNRWSQAIAAAVESALGA